MENVLVLLLVIASLAVAAGLALAIVAALVLFVWNLWCRSRDAWKAIGEP
jgi:hypothetical protein